MPDTTFCENRKEAKIKENASLKTELRGIGEETIWESRFTRFFSRKHSFLSKEGKKKILNNFTSHSLALVIMSNECYLFKSILNTAVSIENCRQLFSQFLAYKIKKIAPYITDIISAADVAVFLDVNASICGKSCLKFFIATWSAVLGRCQSS